MDFHPIASMFSLMDGPEFDALVADIAEHGQREPISLYEGMVLDGRNRWRACKRLGLVPLTREWEGDDPKSFVVSLNLHRRHLTRDERDDLIRYLRGNGMSIRKIASVTGAGLGTTHRAIDSGVPIGTPETITGLDGKQYAPHQVVSVPHVAYNSGNNEWYTPQEYINAARQVMGGIDLDPASSGVANQTVGATEYYTATDDGLAWDWQGRVWMNPPYASNLIGDFCDKLAMHVKLGHVTEACVLVNNATETAWFNALLDSAACVCFIRGRVRFIDAQGNPSGAPLQGQAILYFGQNVDIFGNVFSAFGTVLYARRNSE